MAGRVKDRKRKPLRVAAVALASCALTWFGVNQGRSYVAYRHLQNLDWLRAAAPDEQRVAAHQALGLWLADPHDAFLVILQIGDQSSVPYLRAALERAPRTDIVSCTWTHGREALARLTQART